VSYAEAVGDRLRKMRRQRGLSLVAVEEASEREFKASVLGAYERGERIISVPRLHRLAQLYRVPVDRLLPRTTPRGEPAEDLAGSEAESERCRESDPVRIDLDRLATVDAPERDVIRRYVTMIQAQRGDYDGNLMTIRHDDLQALGRVFERDEIGMHARLRELGLQD
jgi:transcriptional regulator with XRE-family HTH domain